mmetsp:Transcript_29899/g.44979  ORF Transcript_29899/g.44979 Transcript_29899/m.44979 type:complete len:84 (-) Transcript_29899:729-980(-)
MFVPTLAVVPAATIPALHESCAQRTINSTPAMRTSSVSLPPTSLEQSSEIARISFHVAISHGCCEPPLLCDALEAVERSRKKY